MKRKHALILIGTFIFLLQACQLPENILPPTPGMPPVTSTAILSSTDTPAVAVPEVLPTSTETVVAVVAPTATQPAVTETPLPAVTDAPVSTEPIDITFNTNANCRLGPSKNYFSSTSFLKDRATKVEGRNPDGTWLWVKGIEGHCWINVSTIKDPVSFTSLPVVEFPPLPEAPSQLLVTSKDCNGRPTISLRWSNISGETGYNIYRDGITLAVLKANATIYTDYPPVAKEYFYQIEAINEYGLSVRYGQTVQGCKK